jgi:hypothetical protein
MLARSRAIARSEFEQQTGWEFKPEGACKGDVCIPLTQPGDELDVIATAQAMGLPVVTEESLGLIAIGPESQGNRALTSVTAPELDLPDLHGKRLKLSSLRGQKVVVYAWAPY